MAAPPKQDVLHEQPEHIAEHATEVGKERLGRTPLDILITALVGGAEVSLGGLAAMAVVGAVLQVAPGAYLYPALALGALAFPIGFLFVIVGRSELFTENFLIPVVAVLDGERPLLSLLQLWGLSLLGNMVGCALLALLLLQQGTIGEPILHAYSGYAEYKLALPPLGVFYSGMLAGIVMTVLTWLLLAVRDTPSKVVAIFGAGYLLFAGNLSHSVVSAAMLFVGFPSTGHGLSAVLGFVLIASAGNIVGGAGFVTLFRWAQVQEKRRTK